ncbi:CPP1-like family protein [Oscillatoria sp. CS-180]|uniref:CPP1-like family protein n=1 Tax=Oscillatoria sp. CS-180 TaxID=3021720 RepID=UPI00233015A8|nr:CPP1-like family protein [Oscillatoria sp. CS-180]MDB9528604.1 CPP1-like family protein [Oscillatoria sp. CS-180]
MTDQNYYDTLGLDETSSFEEIQEAKDRLMNECGDDRKKMDAIEAAYDAILMERLRLRQEGKIKVPDRIRFAEEVPEKPAPKSSGEDISRPAWMSGLLDTPSRNDVLLPAGVFGILAIVSLAAPSLALAVGVGAAIYFLNRKEYRFWRAILLTILGLSAGLTLGILLGQILGPQGAAMSGASSDAVVQSVAAIVTMIVLWAISSFLR